MVSRLIKFRRSARIKRRYFRPYFKLVEGRVIKYGPEINMQEWCKSCKAFSRCPWLDYYDCLEFNSFPPSPIIIIN